MFKIKGLETGWGGWGLEVRLWGPTHPPAWMIVEILEWTVLAGGKAWNLDVLALGLADLSVNHS